MKKLLFVFAIAAVGSLASCKKDYTCECKDDSGDSFSYEYTGVKKDAAESSCEAAELSWDSCELK